MTTSVEFQALLERQWAVGDQSTVSVEALRAASEQKGASFPIPEDVTCTPVDAGGARAEWSRSPGASDAHVMLFFHGGGYYRGSIAATRELATRLARECAMRGLSVGYRLAPEHAFPAPVEDALAAYRWLLEQGQAPELIAVGGASAGGGLALALLLAAREDGLPLPGAGVCFSPWTDLTQGGDSYQALSAEDPLISKPYLDRFAEMYLQGADPNQPLASPLRGDLAGLPPLLIQVGGAETMVDDSTRLAEKARKAGVDVTLQVWPEMTHVWQGNGPDIPEAREAVKQAGEWVQARLGL